MKKEQMQSQTQTQIRKKYGRPRVAAKAARPNRVVTFVANHELERLEQMAYVEDRPLSAIVHRIVAQYLRIIDEYQQQVDSKLLKSIKIK